MFPDWVCAVSSSSCTLVTEPPAPSSWVLSPGSRAELRRRVVNMILDMMHPPYLQKWVARPAWWRLEAVSL